MSAKKDGERRLSTGVQASQSGKARPTGDMTGSQPKSTCDNKSEPGTCATCGDQFSAPGWTHCCLCDKVVHTACITKAYKATGAEASKNSVTWLQGLLRTMAFRLVCPDCAERAAAQLTATGNAAHSSSATQPCAEAELLRQEVASLQATFIATSAQLMHEMRELKSSCLSLDAAPASSDQDTGKPTTAHATRSASYASVVDSQSITEAVKKAISASIKDTMSSDASSVSIYGLPESDQDCKDVCAMLEALSVNCRPVTGCRMGKATPVTSTKRCRALKVVFGTRGEAQMVLRAARHLRGHHLYNGVRIARFLSNDEMAAVKKLRIQCQQLNKDAGCTDAGKKKYVVIDGELRESDPDGKLTPYKHPAVSSGASTTTLPPKNEGAGSQAAP